MPDFRWPTTQQHTLILGSNGTGKSILGFHMLSKSALDKMPFVIIDFKGEEIANSIPYRKYLDFKDVPKEPGIYILPCNIGDEEKLEQFLVRIHKKERTGLFYDEGYMLPHRAPFKAVNTIYTQGRSKNIPVITLSQRPSWISRYAYSEAAHIAYMRLNDRRDRKIVSEFTPDVKFWNLDIHPEKYHAKWFDTSRNESFLLSPTPKPDVILQAFEDRLRPARKVHW